MTTKISVLRRMLLKDYEVEEYLELVINRKLREEINKELGLE